MSIPQEQMVYPAGIDRFQCNAVMSLAGLPRAMWAGIACMSVCLPFPEDGLERAGKRAAFNIVGCLLFAGLYLLLPNHFIHISG